MDKWKPKELSYRHFDDFVSPEDIFSLVSNPNNVISHKFYPFIRLTHSFVKFTSSNEFNINASRSQRAKKERNIKYACRKDSYIYSYYRFILNEKYESELKNLKLSDVVLAYRRITEPNTNNGKCNIHFARDAFLNIQKKGDCYAVALDISGFFDNIPHKLVKDNWCRLLGCNSLPADHYAVYRSITAYSEVDYFDVIRRLGFYGKAWFKGKYIDRYLIPRKEVPVRLCSAQEFRDKVADKKNIYGPALIKKNKENYGIPQGSPISDIIANFSLLDFDVQINQYALKHGCVYRRYSDDLLLIIPKNDDLLKSIVSFVENEIYKISYGFLKIKKEKTLVSEFVNKDQAVVCVKSIFDGGKMLQNYPFEYLGFSFDGNKVLLKNSTVSRLYRKVTISVRIHAKAISKRYTGYSKEKLIKSFDFPKFQQKYGRIAEFHNVSKEYKSWTFWTYVKRAEEIMVQAGFNSGIMGQIANYKNIIYRRLSRELDRLIHWTL